MKIEVVGSGCTWMKKLSTSFIVDDHIMIDCPQGSFKTMFSQGKLQGIDTVILTHYHSDHWADLHLFVEFCKKSGFTEKIKVFAPEGFWEKFEAMTNAFCLPKTFLYAKEHLAFSKLTNGKVFKVGHINFTAYEVLHIPNSFGFVAGDGRTSVGFSGDTAMCDGLIKILKRSKHIFIDMAATATNDKHLSVSEVLNLSKEFENTVFHPIHFSKFSIAAAKNKIPLTREGEVFEI